MYRGCFYAVYLSKIKSEIDFEPSDFSKIRCT